MKRVLFHVFGILTAGLVYIVWGVKELYKHRKYLALPKAEQNDKALNNAIGKAGITAIIGAILFIGTVAMGGGEEPQQAPEAKPVEQAQPAKQTKQAEKKKPAQEKPKTPEQEVKQLVSDELGETVNIDSKKRVKDVEVSVKTLRITLRADDSLTIGWTAKGMLDDIRRIGPGIRDILKKHDLKMAHIIVMYPLVDQYGNEKEGTVLRLLYDLETMEKINWDKVSIENLPNLSSNTFMHPDIRKGLSK